jgi:hypothetical protein
MSRVRGKQLRAIEIREHAYINERLTSQLSFSKPI